MYKRLIEGKKAIFFDLDGTIADTNYLWTLSVGAVLEKIGMDWITDENKYIPGQDLSAQWKRLIKDFPIQTDKNIETLTKETNEEFLKLLDDSDLGVKDGFWEFLYEIKVDKGLKAILLTNSPKEVALPILKKIGAESAFDLIIYGDEINKPKPDPEIFKKALETLILTPREVLVFEDSLAGTEAARAADLEVVVIWDERYPEEYYKGKIFFWAPDFSPFPGHLDLTYREYVKNYADSLDERDRKIKESKASELGNSNLRKE
jgi:beta-phosphoglucomutase